MKIKGKSNTGGGFKQPPMEAGTYPARTVQILYLGTQEQRPYKGQPKPDAPELMVTYEFLDEFCVNEEGELQEDKPRWLSETFVLHGLGADKAKSTKRYLALDPEQEYDGDWAELINIPCSVTVTANPGKGDKKDVIYNNIAAVSTMRAKDASKAPQLVNPPKLFSAEEPDMEVFGSLPEWLQEKIKKSPEFNGEVTDKTSDDTESDEDESEEGGDEDW